MHEWIARLRGGRTATLLRFLRFLWSRLEADRCQETAAWLTWVTLFALVPTLTVFYSILAMFPTFNAAGEQLLTLLFSFLVPSTGAQVRDYLLGFAEQARHLKLLGTVLIVVSVGWALRDIEDCFNRIWRVEQPRQNLVRFAVHAAIMLLSPLLAAGALLTGTYLGSIELAAGQPGVAEVRSAALYFAPTLLGFAACTLLYRTVPARAVRWRHAAAGSLLVCLAFTTVKAAFTWAVSKSNYSLVYGAFAALPLFLLWLHLMWLLLLYGAEFVHALGYHDDAPVQAREQRAVGAGRVRNEEI
jgi:membrane protein